MCSNCHDIGVRVYTESHLDNGHWLGSGAVYLNGERVGFTYQARLRRNRWKPMWVLRLGEGKGSHLEFEYLDEVKAFVRNKIMLRNGTHVGKVMAWN